MLPRLACSCQPDSSSCCALPIVPNAASAPHSATPHTSTLRSLMHVDQLHKAHVALSVDLAADGWQDRERSRRICLQLPAGLLLLLYSFPPRGMPRKPGQEQGGKEAAKQHTGHHIGYVMTVVYEPAHMKKTYSTILVNIFACVYQYAFVQGTATQQTSKQNTNC